MKKKPLPDVRVHPDVESLSLAAAELFSQAADRAIAERNRLLVALSGGSTPKRMFKILASPPFARRLAWQKIHFFWCDERLVPPDHPESNYGQAFEFLFSQVATLKENLHRIPGEYPFAQAVQEYSRILENFGDVDLKWPRFDLAFLGLGADGHTASLFPGVISPAELDAPVLAVTANYQSRPAARVTLTPVVFNTARNLVFLVSGKDKAYAVFQTLYGSKDLEKYPAQRIQPVSGKVIWLLDKEAASV